MGLYYSEDGRFCTSTIDLTPTTYLTAKGERDTRAAIIIQRWWKCISEQRLKKFQEEVTESSSDDSLFVNGSTFRRRYKRKREDTQSDEEGDVDTYDSEEENTEETEIIDYETSEFSQIDENEDETQLQVVNDNNFLWDFIVSLFSFFKSLLWF